MTQIVDVVNFNSDASCLAAETWMNSLRGGESSLFYQWAQAYVAHRKKVVLGLIGATVADLAFWNPEAVELIDSHPDIFQLICRPYIHDIALLRSPKGFELNVQLGRTVLEHEFGHIVPVFLPPEFMVTGEQIRMLEQAGMTSIFINPNRFSEDIQEQIPNRPYLIKGVLGSRLIGLPFDGSLTSGFLESLYRFDPAPWNQMLAAHPCDPVYIWRDGESAFLIPDGIEREENWLRNEHPDIRREFLTESAFRPPAASAPPQCPNRYYSSYPVHSFSRWMKEFRMLGYIQRVQEIEKKIAAMNPSHLILWLQTINSDVLSAVEKQAHVVRLSVKNAPQLSFEHVIRRSERGFEGEDYLALLEALLEQQSLTYGDRSNSPHMEKLRARQTYMQGILTHDREQ